MQFDECILYQKYIVCLNVYTVLLHSLYTHTTHTYAHIHTIQELQKHILQYYMYTEVLERKRVKMAASVLRI